MSFVVSEVEVSTKVAPRASDVAADLQALSISDLPAVYEIDWRGKVVFENEGDAEKTKPTSGKTGAASSTTVGVEVFPLPDISARPFPRTSTSTRPPNSPRRRTAASAVSTRRSSRFGCSSTFHSSRPSFSHGLA
jgi:hypothetical protein